MSRLTRIVVVVMVTVAALLAQKPDGDDDGDGDEGESGNYSLVENTIHAYEPWTLRGAADDWFILNFTNNWVFPHNSNHWTRCVVLTSGQVWDTTRGTNRLVAVGQQMSAVPDESCFTYELTDDNSYLLTWSNFFLNRDTNQPITASIELKRSGDWIATSNEVSVSHSRVLPFAHDGFGQDADWVRANFTNAEEILSVGYADWVDAQVGYNLTNGLYKFVATFEEDPPECVNLTVGDLSVAVTNAGDYAFLLEKGIDYQFGTFPYLESVEWGAVDDLGGGDPAPMSEVGWGNQATWTVDGGWLDFLPPSPTEHGLVNWLPVFFAEPNVSYLSLTFPSPFFIARISDCKYAEAVRYAWSGGNGDVEIGSPLSQVTPLFFHRFPCSGETSISVMAIFRGRTYVSCLDGLTYGTNDTTRGHLALSLPDTVPVDPGTNGSCFAAMTLSFEADGVTNGTVTLSGGSERVTVFSDSNLVNQVTLPVEWEASAFAGATYWLKGLEASRTLRDEVFTLRFATPDGTNVVADTTTAVRIGDARLTGAPDDGLVVSLGTTVAMDVECAPLIAEPLLATNWSVRRMRGDGTFSPWEDAGTVTNGTTHTFLPATGGVYQVRVCVTSDSFSAERFFRWGDEPDIWGLKKQGDLKAFGVVDEEWQKTLRDTAKAMLGDTSYGLHVNLPSGYGFSGVKNDWKCNQFVARMIRRSGLSVPAPYGRFFRSYPPVANDWANGTPIEGWQWLGRDLFIQPGFVVGHPAPFGPGHCGIVDFDGAGIAAGITEVNRKESKWHDGTSGFSKKTNSSERE